MNTYLLITSIVIFLCILLNRVSNRIGIPALLAFIVLGMLFGSDGIMKIISTITRSPNRYALPR